MARTPAGRCALTASVDGHAVSCLRCGYDLRAVAAGGVCPECGLALAASTGVRERLEECPPGWVRRVAAGAGALAASAVLLAVPAADGMLDNAPIVGSPWGARGAMSARNIAALSFWDFVRMGGWVLVLCGAGLVLQGVGVWLVTAREPGGGRTRAGWRWAWRVLTLVAIAGFAFDLFCGPTTPMWTWSWRDWWLAAGSLVARVAYVACPAIGLWHLRWLTVRIGRPKLAEYAAIVGAGLSGLLLIFLVRSLLVAFMWAAYYHPDVHAWWMYRNVEAIMVIGPAMGVGTAYAVRRVSGVRSRGPGYAWVAVIWMAAAGWAVEMGHQRYTRRLWETVLAVGVPLAAGVMFYLWAVAVLARTAWTLWGAAREAEEAWRRADAAA